MCEYDALVRNCIQIGLTPAQAEKLASCYLACPDHVCIQVEGEPDADS